MDKTIFSVQIAERNIEKFKFFYSDRIQKSDEEYVKYLIRMPECTIKVYNSWKVVFSGVNAYEEALLWGYQENNWKTTETHIGSDEVGTGDYFGPVCVCAAYVTEEDIEWLNQLGIKDSKKLKDEQIMKIVPLLLKRITYSQLSLSNDKYNLLVKKGFNQGMIKAYLHNQAFVNLRNKTNDNKCLTVLDLFVNESRYYAYLKNEKIVAKNIHLETKAETYYPAVAIGSMIARYSYITKMNKLSKELGVEIPKGAGEKVDEVAAQIIKKFGINKLQEIAKMHFKNTEKAQEIINQK